MNRYLLLAISTVALLGSVATPCLAGDDGVNFDGKAAAQSAESEQAERLAAERAFKGLVDELEKVGIQWTFSARTAATAGGINVYLDNLTAKFNPEWYSRYRAFYKSMQSKRYFAGMLAHAEAYTSSDKIYDSSLGRSIYLGELDVELLTESGEVINSVGIHNARSLAGRGINFGRGILSELFSAENPPPVVAPVYTAEGAYITVQEKDMSHVAKLRVKNPRFSKWRWWSMADGF